MEPSRCRVALWATLMALVVACAARDEPRSLAPGSGVPSHRVVSLHYDDSDPDSAGYTAEVVVDPALGEAEVSSVARSIVVGFDRPHLFAVLFFYGDESEVGRPFTVARAWWGPDDPSDRGWEEGDHNAYSITVTMAGDERRGEPSNPDSVSPGEGSDEHG